MSMGSVPQKPKKVPRYFEKRNSNELRFVYAPSFRPTDGSLNENLPCTSVFYIHGLYPSYHRPEVKGPDGEVQMKGRVLSIQTTKDHDIEIPYIGPDEVVAEELRHCWKSLNTDFLDEKLWMHEWNKHGKYHDLSSNKADYWSITLEAARPYLEEFRNVLAGYISGQEYSCLKLQNQFDLLVGHKVDVCFRPRADGKLYLSEVGILFNNSMRIIDHVQPNKQKESSKLFLFEDWCGRFNLPRERETTKDKAAAGIIKRKRKRIRIMKPSFLIQRRHEVGSKKGRRLL